MMHCPKADEFFKLSRAATRLVALAALAIPGTSLAQVPSPVEIARDVYFVQGLAALGSSANRNFISNAGFVITANSVVVIDALGSPTLAQTMVERIKSLTDKPISHVLVTHYHADHIYGLQVFKQAGAMILAHSAAKTYLQSDAARLRLQASRVDLAPWIDDRTELTPADRWIDAVTDLQIGGIRFGLTPAGPAHTPEDLTIAIEERGVIFSGDLAYMGRIPFVGQADSRHWIESVDRLIGLEPKILVPGHGPIVEMPLAALQFTRDYLMFLRESMRTAARDLEPFEDAYLRTDWSTYAALPLFELANRMNAYNTYLLMEQQR